MPRVPEAHYEKRRQEILEAARRVCSRKPIYSVTMKEIVTEAGMSQGGVYKYFSNIDEVYVALLNQATLTREVQADVDALLSEELSPWQKLDGLFRYLGRYIAGAVTGNGRLYFQLMTLYANEPDRFMKIRDQLAEVPVLVYLQGRLQAFLAEAVADGTFRPAVPLEDLVGLITATLSGLAQDAIVAQHVPEGQRLVPAPDVERLVGALAAAVKRLLEGAV